MGLQRHDQRQVSIALGEVVLAVPVCHCCVNQSWRRRYLCKQRALSVRVAVARSWSTVGGGFDNAAVGKYVSNCYDP